MFHQQQELDEAYRATMLCGMSPSDFAVRSMDVRDRHVWVTRGLDSHGVVVSLQRQDIEDAQRALRTIYSEALDHDWAGPGSNAVHLLTLEMAQRFLSALPRGMEAPEVNADPDGEVSFDWDYGRDRLLAVSISLSGRLSFIYRNRSVRMRDTLWFTDDQIPDELVGLYQNLKR
ncbi:MAG: hypothetical protein JNM62_06275 [Flavobacteriales bacterium]|nr:hypothetical protein [Flavobacteriales bacterium]